MSNAGARAMRRRAVEREFREHASEVAKAVAQQFQPVYDRAIERAEKAEEKAAILQTAVEKIALGLATDAKAEAQAALDQLGIVPDVQTEE